MTRKRCHTGRAPAGRPPVTTSTTVPPFTTPESHPPPDSLPTSTTRRRPVEMLTRRRLGSDWRHRLIQTTAGKKRRKETAKPIPPSSSTSSAFCSVSFFSSPSFPSFSGLPARLTRLESPSSWNRRKRCANGYAEFEFNGEDLLSESRHFLWRACYGHPSPALLLQPQHCHRSH
ncbi:unnamed protein product [Cuscuta europaea]|uniref:Uncharacterized protein n=1 Tax=Cuscuta europaea TaxID=41803 RepID=A0A9P0YHR6_CUSEU|nr:unnamed protein product [Cuscuta europaea]